MSLDGQQRPLPPSLFARLSQATRYAITGVSPDTWFGPQQPLAPQAPPEVKGRQWDYPFGANLSYVPRSTGGIAFAELRALADALPLLRAVIETRKDQIAGLSYAVRSRDPAGAADAQARIASCLAFLTRPDRRHSFSAWLRMLLEDMLVIDAACLYPRFDRGGKLYSLDVIDGATITPLIGEDGRSPEAPDPAYQQILHGVPAADFSTDELLYLPRNPRAHRLYGMSPVEQIALTVNIALRRDAATLDYYRAGSTPDAFATLPKDWTVDQIRQFQDYFDALMSGNSARRRMVKFMPSEFRLIEARQPPLKDQYDEWLARVICYAFSVPASAFVSQVNRATSETLRMQATQEGLVPLKAWIKSALDQVIQVHLAAPDLEFVWVGDDAVDPLQQAQTLNILVAAGIKTIAEARADLGLAPEGQEPPVAAVTKWSFDPDQPRDEQGRWASDGAADAADAKQPTDVQVAPNDTPTTMTDIGGASGDDVSVGADAAREKGNSATIENVAYPGDFHDLVLKMELEQYAGAGARCVTELRLQFDGVTARLDALCVAAAGVLIGVDVKTGPSSRLTEEQAFVYPHAMGGAGVVSPDPKISTLGLPPGGLLPPFPIIIVYVSGPGQPKEFFLPIPELETK
jgi:hypothetical protein